mgnify:FL=1
MSASVVIQTARKDDALIVPSSAVDASSGQPTVRVMKKGVVSSVPVEVGMSSDTDTEILSGLSENDVVVTGVVSPTKTQSTGTSPFGRSVGGFGGAGGGVRIGGGGRGG